MIELILAHGGGLVADADAGQMDDALSMLHEDRQQFAELSHRAIETVTKRLSFDEIVARTRAHYAQLATAQ